MAESLLDALKNDRVSRTVYPTRADPHRHVTRYIEPQCNRRWLRSGLVYRTLNDVHKAWTDEYVAAYTQTNPGSNNTNFVYPPADHPPPLGALLSANPRTPLADPGSIGMLHCRPTRIQHRLTRSSSLTMLDI